MVCIDELASSLMESSLVWSASKKDDNERDKRVCAYWTSFRHFYFLFRILGYMPYKPDDGTHEPKTMFTVPNDTDTALIRTSLWWSLWSVVAFFLQVIMVRLEVTERDDKAGNEVVVRLTENYISAWEDVVQLFLLCLDVQFFLSWNQMPSINKYVNSWSRYTSHYEQVTGMPVSSFHYNPYLPVGLIGSSLMVNLILVILDEYLLLHYFERRIILPHFFKLFYNSLLAVFWVSNCIFIMQCSKSLRYLLDNALLSPACPSVLDSYRLLWLDLHHKLTDLADTMGGAVFVLTAGTATCCITCAAQLVIAVSAQDVGQAVALLIPQKTTTVVLLTLCLASHWVSQEIRSAFIFDIVQSKFNSFSAKERTQVETILETIESKPTVVCLCGMLDLDLSLFLNVIVVALAWIAITWKVSV